MNEELKRCPFCDITPLHIDLIVDPQWAGSYVLCGNCGARGPCGPHGSEDWVIKQWNARHEPDDVNRMRNLLEDVVNALDLSEIAIETHGPLGTEPAELVKLVLQQKDREIALLHHESDELPEWLIARINELREFILKSKYSDWKYSLYSDSEQFHILQCEIDKYLGYVLSFRKPEEKE